MCFKIQRHRSRHAMLWKKSCDNAILEIWVSSSRTS